MKKISALIISLMLCITFTACDTGKTLKYISYTENNWWLERETNSTAPAQKQATFDEKDYYSSYEWSIIPSSRHNMRDKYLTEDQNAELSFDSLTGEFAGIFFSQAVSGRYDAEDIENAHDKALEKARSLASEYIDLDEYVLEETQYPYYKDGEENAEIGQHGEGRIIVYDFSFTKKVNGFDTSDSFVVGITSKGDLQAFHAYDTGLFEKREVPEIDAYELGKSIDEKLKDISPKDEYSYKILKQTLTLSPEEKTIVVSQIVLDFKDKYQTAELIVTEI